MRIRRIAADDRQRDLGSGLAAQQADAFEHGKITGRVPVDGAHVVAGLQAGLGGWRTVARGDDPEVVLTRQLDADVSVGESGARLDVLDLRGGQIRAVRIERFGHAAHGPFHHLVDFDRFDVRVQHQADDVAERLEVAKRVVIGVGGGVAEQPADQHERQHRGRHEKDGQPGLESHRVPFPNGG